MNAIAVAMTTRCKQQVESVMVSLLTVLRRLQCLHVLCLNNDSFIFSQQVCVSRVQYFHCLFLVTLNSKLHNHDSNITCFICDTCVLYTVFSLFVFSTCLTLSMSPEWRLESESYKELESDWSTRLLMYSSSSLILLHWHCLQQKCSARNLSF